MQPGDLVSVVAKVDDAEIAVIGNFVRVDTDDFSVVTLKNVLNAKTIRDKVITEMTIRNVFTVSKFDKVYLDDLNENEKRILMQMLPKGGN